QRFDTAPRRSSGLPQSLEGGAGRGDGRLQGGVRLRIGRGEGRERVEREQQLGGLLFADVEQLDDDVHVGVELGAEVAVDELDTAVGKAVTEQGAGKADLRIGVGQALTLLCGMLAEV